MNKSPEKKLDVKLMAFDLDDTLLNNDREISEKNVETLRKCAEKGIYIVLCSGRLEKGILPFIRRLDIAGKETGRYMVALNGCSVFDLHKRMQIYSNKVCGDTLIKADEIARKFGLGTQVYSSDDIYYGEMTPWIKLDMELCRVQGIHVDDYRTFLKKGSPKMLVPGNPDDIPTVQKIMETLKAELSEEAFVCTSKPYFIEILPKNCGKGEALVWLSKNLGIPAEKTLCFGDGMNDESMIKLCNYGVAMKNGTDYIKSIANFITEKTNEEDGVADFIEKYVL